MLDFSTYPRFMAFQKKTIMALDFGQKVIGTAFFCPGLDPFPRMGQKIINKSDRETITALQQLISDEDVQVLVLGIPYYIDGKESDTTRLVKHFGELLTKHFPAMEFFEQDETLSTETAKERMKTSAQFNFKIDFTMIDCLSATIILEDFIRSC